MKDDLRGAVLRVAVFVMVCLMGLFGLVVTFGQLRFDRASTYNAQFSNVSGLESGNFVRIAGVEVGKVGKISLNPDATVNVAFGVDRSVVLTEGSRAAIRYDDLIGGRYLAIEEGAGATKVLNPEGAIPIARTSPALDLDALIGGFRPLFRAMNPDQVNELSGQLIKVFEGQGTTIGSLLTHTADLTNTLADRDQLIGQVVVNLNTVLGSLGDQSTQFAKAVDSLTQLMETLAVRKTDISNSIEYGNAAAASIANLLAQGRPPLQKTVHELERTAEAVVAERDYLDNLLNTLPHIYQTLGRQGLYGDFFQFYLCDIILKVNGKGGQPMYVKVAGQDTGRCTPQ